VEVEESLEAQKVKGTPHRANGGYDERQSHVAIRELGLQPQQGSDAVAVGVGHAAQVQNQRA
jgi:hypothetical protein